ncbi:MAG: hypothetical protein AB7I48_17870 [Planctomycetaceae bacterium]
MHRRRRGSRVASWSDRPPGWLLFGVVALSLVFAAPFSKRINAASPAQQAAGTIVAIERIEIGIGGHFKVGCQAPIAVTFTGQVSEPLQLAVWVPDPDGNLTRQPSVPESVSGNGPHTLRSLFRTGRIDGVIRVDLEANGRVLATHTVRSAAEATPDRVQVFPPDLLDTEYWLVLSGAEAYREAAQQLNQPSGPGASLRSGVVTLIDQNDAADLPTQPGGLDAVDVLAINGAVPLRPPAADAICNWVQQGGHLVLSINSAEIWSGSPFSSWVPIRDVGNSRLRNLDVLRGQFPRSATFNPGTVNALRFDLDDGKTVAETRDGPLWVQIPVCFGRVTLLGLDLAARPLSTWDSLPQLCAHLADHRSDRTDKRQGKRSAQLARTGISDLSTQIAAAIDQFPQIEGASSWTAMGWIVVYLLLVGPVDYLVVHRILRRPHLTWITLPLLVCASAALATSTARHDHATGIVSNQVNLIDLDAASGLTRTHHWSSFVSPATRRYDVQTPFRDWWTPAGKAAGGDEHSAVAHLGWTGVPENGYRGMYRSGGLDLAKPRYRFSAGLTSLEDVPVGIWSSYGITASQHTTIANAASLVGSDLERVGNQLYGTVSSGLPLPLEDWFLADNNLVYFPRSPDNSAGSLSFAPGQTVSIPDTRIGVRTARSFLTGVTNVRRDTKGKANGSDAATREAYDPLSRDFDRIFRAISFYRASGGKDFTTLDNDALERLDLSPFLDLPRAVLYGRIAAAPAELFVDGEPVAPAESETYIRVLLPVRIKR